MQYLVTFTQYHEYWVEADNEEEAEKLGYTNFVRTKGFPLLTPIMMRYQ